MQKIFSLFIFSFCITANAQDGFQMARPLVKFESVFFSDSAKIEFLFAQPGARIYYTIENTMPPGKGNEPSEKSLRYKKPIVLKKQFNIVKAKVYCDGFIPSETFQYSFVKDGKKIKNISAADPNPKYPGSGNGTLFDNKGGIENGTSGTWMGYDEDTVRINVELANQEKISSVLISFLRKESSWIFLPEKIIASYYDEARNSYIPFHEEIILSENESPNSCHFQFLSAKNKNITTRKISLLIMPVKKIPGWHPAKEQHAWCFIDEIKVF